MKRVLYVLKVKTEILIGNETDEIIEELFESLLQKYCKGLEEIMKESGFFSVSYY